MSIGGILLESLAATWSLHSKLLFVTFWLKCKGCQPNRLRSIPHLMFKRPQNLHCSVLGEEFATYRVSHHGQHNAKDARNACREQNSSSLPLLSSSPTALSRWTRNGSRIRWSPLCSGFSRLARVSFEDARPAYKKKRRTTTYDFFFQATTHPLSLCTVRSSSSTCRHVSS